MNQANKIIPWSPRRIKAALSPGAVTRIAQRLGVRTATVSRVIGGHGRARRIEIAVSREIGAPVEEVFGPRGVPGQRAA